MPLEQPVDRPVERILVGIADLIRGNADTYLLRCILTQEKDAGFVYVETRQLANTACLESCRSKEYLASSRCQWRRGWPEP